MLSIAVNLGAAIVKIVVSYRTLVFLFGVFVGLNF